jgi:Ser/Thr protein kinase RdoA (MazF antagonist)
MPAALTLAFLGGRLALIEQGMRGASMARLVFRKGSAFSLARVRRSFARAAAWLQAFQDATAQGSKPWSLGEEEECLSRAFARMGHVLSRQLWHDLLQGARERLRPLRGLEMRRTAQHGDFWAGNVLVDGRALRVVDWDSARFEGVALVDPVLFARAAQRAPALRVRRLGRRFLERCVPEDALDAAVLEGIYFLALLVRCQLAPGAALEGEARALAIALSAPQTYGWLYG